LSRTKSFAAGHHRRPLRSYRAITRHNDGCIIHVRDIQADSDEEAIRIVTEPGADVCTDLWSERGLVQRFGMKTG